jgi:glyoxylase-like metal-dependent hydrolase (beta-lactamase superfamily II)
LKDWETIKAGAATITVLPTPGATVGAISLGVEVGSRRHLFCGEMIDSPGKIARIAPLQYNYNDLSGAVALLYSIGVVRHWAPDLIASSTGADPIEEPQPALKKLDANLRSALAPRPATREAVDAATVDTLEPITDHLYQSHSAGASTFFLVSESHKVLSIDYGYRIGASSGPGYNWPRNRRPLLHGIEQLERDFGIDRIDAVLVTHFHDDHVNGIPMLQRLYGTRCFAAENFADILASPDRYAFPCTWPEPIDVESLPLGQPFQWEEYTFRLHPISGHTRFSTLIEFEVDGRRVVATGDQYFFTDFESPGRTPSMHNHVYRNGAVLSSFAESTALMKRICPDIILPGHGAAYEVPEELYDRITTYTEDYERIHSDLMPLGEEQVHFNVDSRAAWIEPYRVRLDESGPIDLIVHIRNPYPRRTTLTVAPVLPGDWRTERAGATADVGGATTPGEVAVIALGPREEGTAHLRVVPPVDLTCRRLPIAVELIGPDRTFGQVAEALVTIGHERF